MPLNTPLLFQLVLAFVDQTPPAPEPPPANDIAAAQAKNTTKALKALQEELEETKIAKDDAESRYKDLATGKFIESGVTGGIAMMLHSELSSGRDSIKQRTSEITAVPYVLFLPGYWGSKPEVDKYCAGRFNAGSVEAQESADSNAMRRAEIPLKALLAGVEANRTLEEIRGWIGSSAGGDTKNPSLKQLSSATYELAKLYVTDKKKNDPELREALVERRDLLLRAIAAEVIGWTPGVPPKTRYCVGRKFGIWVGFPINSFKARIESYTVDVDAERNKERDVRPIVSFGLGIAPNAIVTGLVGVSYSVVRLPNDPMDLEKTNPYGYWSFTAGIGGNLDIINLFRRK